MIMKPGSNEYVMQGIKKKCKQLKAEDKNVMFVMDETKLKQRLLFTSGSKYVTGFASDSCGSRTSEIAGSVLVGMIIVAINSSFKQPVSYHFSKAGFNADGLKKIVQETIKDLVDAGLSVVGVVTDQGKANKTALDSLRNETEGGKEGVFFKIAGYDKKIYILSDITHLIKTSRNCFMGDWSDWFRKVSEVDKNNWNYEGNTIEINGKTAYWRDVIDLFSYCLNKNEPTNVTEEHIFPSSSNKMKVCFASQVFSSTVADALTTLANKHPHKYPTAADTAEVLRLFDDAFDHMNSSNLKKKTKSSTVADAMFHKHLAI
ncbi:uncharacterized protein LOC124174767 [Neodiprion fabricii]|uniref:uncharacterized protein LOC124174767 n=1 Tax=Neodiprion fabricii TaxID=2872261 RepID=UPI001ED90B7E|nr:uncharacterized protein LOC124174767 [Neodiprion fabricii]